MLFRYFFCVVLMIWIIDQNAQTVPQYLISGTILDAKNQPVKNITLNLCGNGRRDYTVSNPYGFFSFKVPAGNYTLVPNKYEGINFYPELLDVNIKNKDKSDIILKIELKNEVKQQFNLAAKFIPEAVKMGAQLLDLIAVIKCPNCGPFAPLITGDPNDALPPGIRVEIGSGTGLIWNGKVILGDKNLVIWNSGH